MSATPNILEQLESGAVDGIDSTSMITVEVGPGVRSLANSDMYQHLCVQGLYLAINIDQRQHEALQQASIYDTHRQHGFRELLIESGELPKLLGNTAIDKAIVSNVLGEPHSLFNYKSKPIINPGGGNYSGSTNRQSKQQLLNQLRNLATVNTELDIWETLTPITQLQMKRMLYEASWGEFTVRTSQQPGFTMLKQAAGLGQDDARPGFNPQLFVTARVTR